MSLHAIHYLYILVIIKLECFVIKPIFLYKIYLKVDLELLSSVKFSENGTNAIRVDGFFLHV